MNWKVLKTEAAYKKAAKRTMEIFHAREGTAEAEIFFQSASSQSS